MLNRITLATGLSVALLAGGCAPATVVTPAGAPAPAASEPAAQATAPPASAPRQVRIQGPVQALAGARVDVLSAVDLTPLADDLAFDAQGSAVLTLGDRLPPGTAVVVRAKTDAAVLTGLFVVPAEGFSVQQAVANDWLLDLASSLVARKLTTKFSEVARSTPPGGSAGLAALSAQLSELASRARDTFATTASSAAVASFVQTATSAPTAANVEALANALIGQSTLRGAFVEAVEACNRHVVDNLAAGGPLVLPSAWRVLDADVPAPTLKALDGQHIEVQYGDRRVTLPVADADARLERARRESADPATNAQFGDLNTIWVAPRSGGGGSGPRPSLSGVIRVAGVARAKALVQLTRLDGTIVAKTASDAGGAYAFYNVPDGTYQLVVAVDGAAQSTSLVTVGTPI